MSEKRTEDLCFARLWSADGLMTEIRINKKEFRPKIETAISPLVKRVYEFKDEMLGNLFNVPIEVDGMKLNSYSTVTLRIYKEKLAAADEYAKGEKWNFFVGLGGIRGDWPWLAIFKRPLFSALDARKFIRFGMNGYDHPHREEGGLDYQK